MWGLYGLSLLYIAAVYTCVLTMDNAEPPTGPVVDLNAGSVRGLSYQIAFGYRLDRFLGIPYAAPPIGELRFPAPQPTTPWEGVRDATRFANKCPQNSVPFPWNVTVGKLK